MTFTEWLVELKSVLTKPPHNMTDDGADRFITGQGRDYWSDLCAEGFSPEEAALEDGEFEDPPQ